MKTQFLKNVIPFGVIALGLSGAFVTTSMQKASAASLQIGYQLDAFGECSNNTANCETEENQFVCRINGTTGAQAWGKDNNGDCVVKLYRPE
ncbi:hypothetical protein [Flavobacterium hibernum]|uniref:Uncharacterized protein n=1 Tax=Flavobacterium hibernum TaxID=37752 RepID=A0A0D0F9H0_9FLAO|nr:hypothetical protein [Flavobacterium hibernum]KIO54672.1 hypothetical protein IW18_01305 [Flavobacterium hibernum]OXA84742.1 hypothetical protein B0A73_19210 [Flavobacterium hibernum]STO18420.1 Uncharacterised protein [Flavobacterium hibernum]